MSVDFSHLPREKLIALLLESRKQADAAKAEAAVALQHAAEVEVRLDLSEKKYAAAAVFLSDSRHAPGCGAQYRCGSRGEQTAF